MAAHPEEQDAGKTAVIPLGLGVVMLTSAGLWSGRWISLHD